jgi:thiol-disulfide isomerase/thioredoxin
MRYSPFSSFLLPAVATVAALILPSTASALEVGDAAPLLTVKSFVKGKPIPAKLAANQTYVVEFWATWCGPCKATIPHLTQLQKQNPKVNFIGVSILEENQSGVKPFVTQMGAKMGYTVAMDTGLGEKGFMAKNWFNAAGENGIPTSFIVKDGKIAWIGHPMEMEEPLKKIQAGTWDIKAERTKRVTQKTNTKKMMAVQKKATPFLQAQKYDKALEVIDVAITETPSLEAQLSSMKLNLLLMLGKNEEAATYGEHLVTDVLKDPMSLNAFAWGIVDPKARKKVKELYPAAQKAAQKAVDLTQGKELDILDTLAWTYFANGDVAKAIEIETKLVEAKKDNPDYASSLAAFKKGQ